MKEKKDISKMTEEEILRQQLELLAEKSLTCENAILSKNSEIMLGIATYLSSRDLNVS